MKIHFSKKEYRHLIDLLEIADWVINSHRIGRKGEPKHYGDLIQKIFSYAKQMHCEDIIEYEASLDSYFLTAEAEENSKGRPFLDEFEETTFWDKLVEHLAARDLYYEFGEGFKDLSPEERVKAIFAAEEPWHEEFDTYGLQRIGIVKKPGQVKLT